MCVEHMLAIFKSASQSNKAKVHPSLTLFFLQCVAVVVFVQSRLFFALSAVSLLG